MQIEFNHPLRLKSTIFSTPHQPVPKEPQTTCNMMVTIMIRTQQKGLSKKALEIATTRQCCTASPSSVILFSPSFFCRKHTKISTELFRVLSVFIFV